MYELTDIIDKTLYAKRPVQILKLPYDGAQVLYTVGPGQLVGVVDTYFLPSPQNGRTKIYWGFLDINNNPYYAAHEVGAYDLEALQAQGLLSIQEQDIIDQYPEWYTLAGDVVGQAKGLIWYAVGAVILVKVIPKLFK